MTTRDLPAGSAEAIVSLGHGALHMGFLNKFLRRGKPTPIPVHQGHFAALGSKLARALSEHGMRHTAMTQEHLLCDKNGGLRLCGFGNAREMDWPQDARLHTSDIRVFRDAIGLAPAAGLRLGYVYELGPIAEWVFYDPDDADRLEHAEDPPAVLKEQWPQPSDDMSLGEDSGLPEEETAGLINKGISLSKERSYSAAKRVFLRCYLGGMALKDRKLEVVSLAGLANVFRDEGRLLRAYGLSTLAMMGAASIGEALPGFISSLIVNLRSEVSQSDKNAMNSIVDSEPWMSSAEFMWKFDDFEIRRMLKLG